MPPSVLFLIKSNPLRSHRPAEAIRIAVGLGTNKNPLTLILIHEATRLLNYENEELEEIETVEQYLPILEEWDIPILVEKGSLDRMNLKDHSFQLEEVSATEISQQLAQADRTFIF